MLSIIHIVQLILFALMMSTGQFLFKKTAISIETINSPIPVSFGLIDGLFRALHVPWFYMAIFLYSLATLFWLYILLIFLTCIIIFAGWLPRNKIIIKMIKTIKN